MFLTRLRFLRASIGFSLSLCAFIPFYRPALFRTLSSARIFLGPSLSLPARAFPAPLRSAFFCLPPYADSGGLCPPAFPSPFACKAGRRQTAAGSGVYSKKNAPPKALRPKNAALGAESGKKAKNDETIRMKGKARTAKRSLSRSSTSCGRRFARRHRPQDAPEEASCF